MNRLAVFLFALILTGCRENHAPKNTFEVQATAETDPGPLKGDVIDDSALWVNHQNSGDSILIATDKSKQELGGLRLYGLDGHQVAFVQSGRMNNVDVRYGFPLNGDKVDVIVASDRDRNTLAIYKMGADGRSLQDITGRLARPDQPVYGMCLYHHRDDNQFYAFITSTQGRVQQWRLTGNDKGTVDAQLTRTFEVGSKAEGCVADDDLNVFYVSEEKKGIWRYSALSDANESRTLVDEVGERLDADVEGLTIYYGPGKEGYLLASSQGNSTYSIYKRQGSNVYVGNFRIVDGALGGARKTDGIDVTSTPLGPQFPQGLFIAHNDGFGTGRGSNLKLVPWEAIAAHLQGKK